MIGFGTGLFSVGTMIAAMGLAQNANSGMALGAWGAVQASCAGLGVALGGLLRDTLTYTALHDGLGHALAGHATGYGTVYLIEIALLLAALVVIGPVTGMQRNFGQNIGRENKESFGLSEFPT